MAKVFSRSVEVLVDSGFYSEAAVTQAEQKTDGASAPVIYAATGRHPHGRSVERLEKHDDPPAPGKGSAIFLHVARPDYGPTEGCVALALENLLEVAAACGPGDTIRINPPDNTKAR